MPSPCVVFAGRDRPPEAPTQRGSGAAPKEARPVGADEQDQKTDDRRLDGDPERAGQCFAEAVRQTALPEPPRGEGIEGVIAKAADKEGGRAGPQPNAE